MFIDNLNAAQCWSLWHVIHQGPIKAARKFFPHKPAHYVKATRGIASYCSNKGTALNLIHQGHPIKGPRVKEYLKIAAECWTDLPHYARAIPDDLLPRELNTDPYGTLEFAIGDSNDFICFDYDIDRSTNRIKLHAVINSETGSFIQDFATPEHFYNTQWPESVKRAALELTELALEWIKDNDVKHDADGWNQDPFYYYRSVCAALENSATVPRLTNYLAKCALCGERAQVDDMHRHQGELIGPCCWDERLKITE